MSGRTPKPAGSVTKRKGKAPKAKVEAPPTLAEQTAAFSLFQRQRGIVDGFNKQLDDMAKRMIEVHGDAGRAALAELKYTPAETPTTPAPTSNAVDPVESSDSLAPVPPPPLVEVNPEQMQAWLKTQENPEALLALPAEEIVARYQRDQSAPEATTTPDVVATPETVTPEVISTDTVPPTPGFRTAADLSPEERAALQVYFKDDVINGMQGDILEDTLASAINWEKENGSTAAGPVATDDALAAAVADTGEPMDFAAANAQYQQARAQQMFGARVSPRQPMVSRSPLAGLTEDVSPAVDAPVSIADMQARNAAAYQQRMGRTGDMTPQPEMAPPAPVDPLAGLLESMPVEQPAPGAVIDPLAGLLEALPVEPNMAMQPSFPVSVTEVANTLPQLVMPDYPAAQPRPAPPPTSTFDPAVLNSPDVQVVLAGEGALGSRPEIPPGPIDVTPFAGQTGVIVNRGTPESRIREMQAEQARQAQAGAAPTPTPGKSLLESMGMNKPAAFGDIPYAGTIYKNLPTIAKVAVGAGTLGGALYGAANYFSDPNDSKDASAKFDAMINATLMDPNNPFAKPK